jgi:acetyl-CoA C-acetyltransferase
MSNAPHYVRGMRNGVKFGAQTMQDGLITDGLWCAFYDRHMGGHAEYTAKKAGITRQRQDEFAFASHQKAVAAIEGGKFRAEIAAVEIAGKKPVVIDTDESPRKDTSLEALGKLRPAFPKDAPKDMKPEELTVTAGNAPGLNDGAAAVVVASEGYARAHGLPILARITGYASGGGDPQDLFFAPIVAVNNLMQKTGMTIGDYDLIEANEAFASQALADGDALGWAWDRVNVHGGAIALGHPIGASGARVLVTLLHALRAQGKRTGMATLCLGGGNAVALSVEMV